MEILRIYFAVHIRQKLQFIVHLMPIEIILVSVLLFKKNEYWILETNVSRGTMKKVDFLIKYTSLIIRVLPIHGSTSIIQEHELIFSPLAVYNI